MVKQIKKTKYAEALKKLKQKSKKPVTKSRPKPVSKPKPKPKPRPKPRPKSRPKPRPKFKPKPKTRSKPKPKPRKKIIKKKPVKKKIIRKIKPKKRIVKKKPIKRAKPKLKKKTVKPRKKIVKKRIVKKVIRKPKKKVVKPKRKVRPKKRIIKKKPIKRAKPKLKKKTVKPRKKIVKKRIVKRPKKKKVIKPRVYIGKGTLDQLFESQAKVKLLKFFFRNAEDIFPPREIFKRLRSNAVLLNQEMKKLEKLGLIKQKKAWLTFERKRGGIRKERKTVWYLNPSFDFLGELRDLVLKSTIASKTELVEKARRIGNLKLLVLNGLFVGNHTARADLLIVGDRINHRKLSVFLKDLEAEVGKEINCAVMKSKEFDYRYDMYDRFVRDLVEGNCEILIKKIELW